MGRDFTVGNEGPEYLVGALVWVLARERGIHVEDAAERAGVAAAKLDRTALAAVFDDGV